MPLPRVVIAGRPNVGKSALFNALARRRFAIVDPTPGITRDLVELPLTWGGKPLLLVDTGGLGSSEDPLEAKVRRKAEDALAGADLVLLVVDVRIGVADEDRTVARRLHRLGKGVVVVANKCDVPALDAQAGVFEALGFGPALPVSAVELREVAELREAVARRLGEPGKGEETPKLVRLALLGRRNVGKSTLVNALCGTDRVLVDSLPGTTRDAVEVPFRIKGGSWAAIDTAGFRKEGRIEHPVEIYAASRAREALAACDVALLVLDASTSISALDKKIAREIRQAAKPVLLVANKWDLLGDIRTGAYQAHLESTLTGLAFAPLLMVSARDGRNLKAVLHVARALASQAEARVPTAFLNRELGRILRTTTGPGGSRFPKVLFAAQTGTRPPTIRITVNDPDLFPPAWRRTLEARLREVLPFREIPFRLVFHRRGNRDR